MKWEEHFTYNNGELISKLTNQSVGNADKKGYKRFYFNGTSNSVSRVIWQICKGSIPDGMQVDHINHNPSDNKIDNLQLISNTQNQQRKTTHKGYCWIPFRQMFQSQKFFNNKKYFLGYFGTPCGAYMANRMFFVK